VCNDSDVSEARSAPRSEAETRRRIVEAAVALHTSVGPARTSIAAVAREAGCSATPCTRTSRRAVSLRACAAHWTLLHRSREADVGAGRGPAQAAARALREVYRWYEEVEPTTCAVHPRRGEHSRRRSQWEEWESGLRRLADSLAIGPRRSQPVRAAVGHALAFETWRSLVRREGLTNARASVRCRARRERVDRRTMGRWPRSARPSPESS
jgi:hypothetical protein